jgi:hypothetical protein
VAHALHQFRGCAPRQLIQSGVAGGALPDPGAHFDELVIGERAFEFIDHAVGEAGVAEHHQGVQRMGEAAQVFLLLFRKLHGRIIVAALKPARRP